MQQGFPWLSPQQQARRHPLVTVALRRLCSASTNDLGIRFWRWACQKLRDQRLGDTNAARVFTAAGPIFSILVLVTCSFNIRILLESLSSTLKTTAR